MNICGASINHFGPFYQYLNMIVLSWCILTDFLKFFMCYEAGPKSTTCFENQSFSSQIYVFHDFVVLCSFCDFGPCDFNNEKDRSHVWILIEWAEVIDWSTTNVHFGLLGKAKMTQSITNNFTIKNMTFDRNFTFFHHLRESFNFTSGFRPKYGSNRKVFCRD